jgi:hypothetical protein
MADFPTLIPNSISFNHGVPQISEYNAFGVGPVRFNHTDFVNGQEYQITYRALEQEAVQLIRDHYQVSGGTAGHFGVPTAVLPDINTRDSSTQYRYAETPSEEHIGLQKYSVTISLIAVEGVLVKFILEGGPASVPAEEAADVFVFSGTAPFILNGSSSTLATLRLNGS